MIGRKALKTKAKKIKKQKFFLSDFGWPLLRRVFSDIGRPVN